MKKCTRILIPALALMTLPLSSPADVNMKDASFQVKVTDFEIGKYKFERTYNSRSLHQGLFGFGWCTDFEKKLSFEKNEILLHDCSLDAAIKVTPQKKKKLWIVKRNNEIQTYNLQGHLMSLETPHRRKQSITYSSEGFIDTITISPRLQFRLSHLNGALVTKVIRLKSPSSQEWSFEYQNGDWIRSGKNFAKYDDYHNLVELKVDTVETKISYSSDLDEVRSVTSGSCRDNYDFSKGEGLQLSRLERLCDGKLTQALSFAFEFRRNPSGQNILSRLRVFDLLSKNLRTDASFFNNKGRNALGDNSELETYP